MFQNSFCITHVPVGKTCSFCMLLLENFTYSKRNWDIHKPAFVGKQNAGLLCEATSRFWSLRLLLELLLLEAA